MLNFCLLSHNRTIFLKRAFQTFLATFLASGLILKISGCTILTTYLTLFKNTYFLGLFMNFYVVKHRADSTRESDQVFSCGEFKPLLLRNVFFSG